MMRPQKCDPSKVFVKGLGSVQSIPNIRNELTINCSLAENGILQAGIINESGMPADIFQIIHIGANIFVCTYRVTEKCDYWLVVKYDDQEVPGSPFHLRST